MKYAETLKNLWQAASREESRRINAIKIDAERKVAVATDGHMMAVIDVSYLLEPDEKSFLLPSVALKAARQLYLAERANYIGLPLYAREARMRHIYIRATEDAVTVYVGTSKRGQSFDAVKGEFPEWEGIAPKTPGDKGITVSLGHLQRLVAALQGSYAREDAVTVYVSGPEQVTVIAVNSHTQTYGLLMPMRSEHKPPVTFWDTQLRTTNPPTPARLSLP